MDIFFLITTVFEISADFEKKAIKATAEVQEALGCGVSFHPGK